MIIWIILKIILVCSIALFILTLLWIREKGFSFRENSNRWDFYDQLGDLDRFDRLVEEEKDPDTKKHLLFIRSLMWLGFLVAMSIGIALLIRGWLA